ncbi:MAG: hypothetical protein ACQETI_13270 [Halobacteriota archaeon]
MNGKPMGVVSDYRSSMASFADSFDDPRVTADRCRQVRTASGSVILVGVVHDHPASVARVEAVVDRVGSPTLALELPPAAVPLYRAYAADGEGRPRFGGEMSAAIAAAPTAPVVGIDAPNWSFCRRLCSRALAGRLSPTMTRRLLRSLAGATREAATCRVAATLTDATAMTVAFDDPVSYTCSADEPPARQADHERAHVDAVDALLDGASPESSVVAQRDELREGSMLDRLRSLDSVGPIVAVVGVDHLDRLESGLEP